MPLTKKGQQIMKDMKKEYGKGAEKVFYATRNSGKLTGVDKVKTPQKGLQDPKRFA